MDNEQNQMPTTQPTAPVMPTPLMSNGSMPTQTPVAITVIGVLMIIGGVLGIIIGLPLLLLFGLGIIPIALGALNIKIALDIFKMRKKGYQWAMGLEIVAIVLSSIWSFSIGLRSNFGGIVDIIWALIVVGILYSYRDKFTVV